MSYDELITAGRNFGKTMAPACLGLCVLLLLGGCDQEREYRTSSGLTVTRLDPELEDRWGTAGVVVKASAAASGLTTGDLITHVVSRTVVSDEDALTAALRRAIGSQKAAWEVRKVDPSDASAVLEVERDGETLHIELATVEPRDWADHGMSFSGMRIQSVTAGFEHAPARSPALSSGLKVGDRVVAVIDEQVVPSVKEFRKTWEVASASTETYVYTHELTGIRLEAIGALGQLGGSSPAAMARLIEILEASDDPAVRRTAAGGLEALAGSQDGSALLRAMLPHIAHENEVDVEIRRNAINIVEALAARLPDAAFDDASIGLVASAMADEDPGVHFKAGVILGSIGERAVPVLLTALEDASSLRAQDIAATALGDIGGDVARRALVSALGATTDVPLQLTIATALAKISDGPALSELRALLDRTENSGVREFVRQLLDTDSGSLMDGAPDSMVSRS
ncbi:hypothetical protein HN371_23785 [Candidatus Poribacteria bacterium]|nr:hypothetical protein [Candidatus Poribacteria bacterium]MBT5531850.1 hypothetical protein [Candidatus Poribacteria bacterium]MBT5711387.1 hypothetical protein [Candidatus Poribacteria bacterium]MBT7806844.1 hypothetical protein [Candidatus Poribacteria bacterium]